MSENSFAPDSAIQGLRAMNVAAMTATVGIYTMARVRQPGGSIKEIPTYDRTVPGRLSRVTAIPATGGEHTASARTWLLVLDMDQILAVGTVVHVEGKDVSGRAWSVLAVVEDTLGPHSFAVAARYTVGDRRARTLALVGSKLDGTWKLNGARSLKGVAVSGFVSPS